MDWKFGDEAVPLKRDLDDGGLRSGVMTYTKKKADRPGSIRSLCAEHTQAGVNDESHEGLILTCRNVSHVQALRDCFVRNDVPGGPAIELHDCITQIAIFNLHHTRTGACQIQRVQQNLRCHKRVLCECL